jgi:fucose permease
MRRPAVAVAALQVALFVALGLPDGGLGVAWPSMRGAVGRPLGALGLVLAAGTIGYVAGSPSVSTMARRFGTPRTMMVSSAVAAGALAVWSATRSWPLLLVMSFVLGIARGMIDAGLNAYVALHGGVRRLGLLHGAYGLGTSLGSLLIVASLATGSWRPAWVVMAALDAGVAVWAARRRDDWPPDVVVRPDVVDDAGAPPNRAVLVIAVTVVCFAALVGAEYSTGVWSYTLLTDGRGVGDTAAGLWVASYWGGLTVARFAVGAFGNRVGRVTLLHMSCAVALAGVGLLWWNPGGIGVLGLPLAGVGFAAIFPALVALMPDRLGAHRSSAVIGWSVAAASLGGTGVAAAAGVLVDQHGAGVLGPTLFAVTMAMVVLHLVLVAVAPVRTTAARPADPVAAPLPR